MHIKLNIIRTLRFWLRHITTKMRNISSSDHESWNIVTKIFEYMVPRLLLYFQEVLNIAILKIHRL